MFAMVDDAKYPNRARLEAWLQRIGGRVAYRRDDAGWTAVVEMPGSPETWVVSSGVRESLEESCAAAIERFAESGESVDELMVHGEGVEQPTAKQLVIDPMKALRQQSDRLRELRGPTTG